MPKLTCITTTYNEGPALMASVRSVLAQGFRDFQYIIVDDGSSKETLAVLAKLDDPRITVVMQANDGLSSARNTALELATGDYICFLDADDTRPNWSFAAISKAIDSSKADLLLCPGILQDLRGDIKDFYDADIFEQISCLGPEETFLRDNPIYSKICTLVQQIEPQSANKIIRRQFLEKSNIKFPNTHFFEDIFFHTNIICESQSITFLDCPTFTYFKRYQRPQITATASDLRFDIIAVSKMTLESFARRPEVHDPAHRAAVLASCLKIMEWCETFVSLHHRRAFRQCAQAMIRLVDPLFTHIPSSLPPEAGNLDQARRYLAVLTSTV